MRSFFLIIPIGFLIITLSLSSLILFSWQIFLQHQHHQKENIVQHSAHFIIKEVNLEDFNKNILNNSKEIIIDEQLYDIISFQKKDKTLILKLYKDDQEQSILLKLKKWIELLKNCKNFNSFFFFESDFSSQPLIFPVTTNIPRCMFFSIQNTLNVFLSIPSPPPRV
ncbi:MAG: hypothetical protein N2203_06730 [Bacteroidia bacterium]|nr:hypothetical protein [Bacteroidia bacterium]